MMDGGVRLTPSYFIFISTTRGTGIDTGTCTSIVFIFSSIILTTSAVSSANFGSTLIFASKLRTIIVQAAYYIDRPFLISFMSQDLII